MACSDKARQLTHDYARVAPGQSPQTKPNKGYQCSRQVSNERTTSSQSRGPTFLSSTRAQEHTGSALHATVSRCHGAGTRRRLSLCIAQRLAALHVAASTSMKPVKRCASPSALGQCRRRAVECALSSGGWAGEHHLRATPVLWPDLSAICDATISPAPRRFPSGSSAERRPRASQGGVARPRSSPLTTQLHSEFCCGNSRIFCCRCSISSSTICIRDKLITTRRL